MSSEVSEGSLITIEDLIARVQGYSSSKELDLIKRAYAFAKEHYANIDHPTGISYSEYVLHVSMLLADLRANSTMIAAAITCPPPSVIGEDLSELSIQFRDETDLLELVKDMLYVSSFEWNIWPDGVEGNEGRQREETLRRMFLLAIGEPNSEDYGQDYSTAFHFQKREKQAENLIKMFLVAVNDARALVIKLTDCRYLMERLRDLQPSARELLDYKQLARIALIIYVPLADRLGIWQLKSQLEDISFQLLQPEQYMKLTKELNNWGQDGEGFITDVIIPTIRTKLEENRIKADISGRAKHIYSIYRKMEAKQLKLDEINDLLGIRIIVDQKETCYKALSVLFALGHPVTNPYNGKAGRDWIAHPKDNGYQSLHTTIFLHGKNVEVQIRTHEMHEKAEYGSLAGHWRYKEDKHYRRGKPLEKMFWKEEIWNEEWAEVHKKLEITSSSPTKQKELLKKWIFVITPKGHVIELRTGARPLDFAYRIHTELGNRYTGAKVSDHIIHTELRHKYTGARVSNHLVRMDYELKNGEIIELITSRVAKGPKFEWLSRGKDKDGNSNYLFVRTPKARSKILTQLKKQNSR